MNKAGRPPTPSLQRFWPKIRVDPETGCWEWTAGRTLGYGRFTLADGRGVGAHVFSYLTFVGPIPIGLELDHTCRNRGCVNPEHLEPVTTAINVLRGNGITALNVRKTVCKNGHEFTESNTYNPPSGGRICRECKRVSGRDAYPSRRQWFKDYYIRKKEAICG